MEKMRELDIARFWADDALAHEDNCFSERAPQVAFGVQMPYECVYDELGIPGHPWEKRPPELMRRYIKSYNDKAEGIVGIRPLSEEYPSPMSAFPYLKRIGEIFGSRYFMHDHSEWLDECVKSPEELEALLNKVESMDIEGFVVPDNWDNEVKRIYEQTGLRPDPIKLQGHFIRGPVTLATSLMGAEDFLMLYYDEPELTVRFSQAIRDAVIKRGKAIDKACGYTEENRPFGYQFNDDNCCLTTPKMYEAFGYPILRDVFAYFSPNEGDMRYQHSDSPMAHLLKILARVNLTGCNFGPTVLVDAIRGHMPRTRIDGCIAPLVFARNEEDELVSQVKRDCEMILASGTRGLNLSMAGSISYGSSLKSMRLLMQAVQNFGRY